jgi:hypothetical protein
MKTSKTIVTIAIAIISLLGLIGYVVILNGEGTIVKDGLETHDDYAAGLMIQFTMVLTLIALAIAVIWGVIRLALNIKKNIPVLVGIGLFAIFMVIMKSLTNSEMPITASSGSISTEGLSASWGDAGFGINSTFVLILITFALALLWGAYNGIKKQLN